MSIPPATNLACVVLGGRTEKEQYSSTVYGLNQHLTEWTLLGNIKSERRGHIALPLL